MKTPNTPAGLSREAQTLWRSTLKNWPVEREATLLTCLRSACFALDRLRTAERLLAEDGGGGVYDVKGITKQHPLTLVIRDANKQVLDNLRALSLDLEAVNKIKGVIDPDMEIPEPDEVP
jgi:phage terminase small subunit